jgi:ribosome-associated toxin RatA of RatAB toxin-antitoxin module
LGLALASSAALADDPVVSVVPVAGSNVPKVVVSATLDVTPEQVWAVVSDCSKYKGRMPRVVAAKQLTQDGDTRTCEVTIEVPFSQLTAVTQAVHVETRERYSRTWKLVRGDYRINEGSWEIVPADEARSTTKVTYSLRADPKAALPNWIRESAQRKALPELLERVRQEAKKL